MASQSSREYRWSQRQQQAVEKKKALLETLSLTLSEFDKGVVDPGKFGSVLERLQLFLEAEEPEPGEFLHGYRYGIGGLLANTVAQWLYVIAVSTCVGISPWVHACVQGSRHRLSMGSPR